MAEDLISEYVDRNGVKGDTDFILTALREVYSEFKKIEGIRIDLKGLNGLATVIPGIAKAKDGINSYENAVKRASDILVKHNGHSKELNQIMIAQAKVQKETAQATLLNAKAANENAKAKATESKATEQSTKAKSNESKLIDQATNDYLQLSKAYNEAALKAKNYFLVLGENHPTTVQAVKDANDIGNVLKKADASVGQFQRNVGNYKSAFDGLGFSFTQVARELPVLAINFQTFALAISNNLPIVADEIAKAKREIAALKAEGKDTPSLFQRISKSILSPQIGLSLLITGFTLFASKLFGTGAAAKKLKEETKELTSAIRDQVDAFREQIDTLNSLDNEMTKELKRQIELKNAAGKSSIQDEIKLAEEENKIAKQRATQAAKNYGLNAKDAQDTEKALKHLKFVRDNALVDYRYYLDRSIKERNKYFGTKEKFDKEEAEQLAAKAANEKRHYEETSKIFDDVSSSELRIQGSRIRAAREAAQEGKDNAEESAKERLDLLERNLKAEFEIRKLGLQQDIDFSKEVVDNEKASLTTRLGNILLYQSRKIELINRAAAFEISTGKKTAKELELIEDNRKDAIRRLERETTKLRSEIHTSFKNKIQTEEKELQDKLAKIAEEGTKNYLDNDEKKRDALKKIGDEILENEKKIAEDKKKLYSDLYAALAETATAFFTAADDRRIADIQSDVDLLELRKQKDIEVVNQTVANRQEAAAQISIIEAQAQAEREQLEARQRDIEKRKASIERLGHIASIIGNTVNTVVALTVKAAEAKATAALLAANPATAVFAPNALLQAGLITSQIPVVVGISAAQIARLAIPRYKDGKPKNDDYEGYAIWGDGGKPEAKISEDGKVEISGSTPSITHVKKRDVILPDANQLINYVLAGHMGGRLNAKPVQSDNSVENEIKSMKKEVVAALKNMPQSKITVANPLSQKIRSAGGSNNHLFREL